MKNHSVNGHGQAERYASAEDFCAIFLRDMRSLYLLALMLTGDDAKAESCLTAAFEECRNATSVFKPWANSWSRLRVVDQAMRAIHPRAGREAQSGTESRDRQPLPAELAAVLTLDDFRRFVYVLTVLEPYSVRDAAILLKHGKREIASAQRQAIQLLGQAMVPVESFLSGSLPASLTA